MGTKPILIKSIMTDSKAKFTKELLEEIRNRIGKDATEEEAGAYLRSLSPEELSDLTIPFQFYQEMVGRRIVTLMMTTITLFMTMMLSMKVQDCWSVCPL